MKWSDGPPAVQSVEALRAIANALRALGNAEASTPYGAIEALGMVISDAAKTIASSLDDLAHAIREGNDG